MHHLMGVLVLVALAPATALADPEAWFENPTRTRSLIGHTALPLHEGEGYVGQQAFFFTTAGVGLSERVSVNVTTAMPAMALVTEVQFNLMAGIKVATPLAEDLHGAIGLQSAFLSVGSTSVDSLLTLMPYGTLTFGTADAHLTATLQPILLVEDGAGSVTLLPSVSGFVRMFRNVGLVGEALLWLPLRDHHATYALPMAGVRTFGEHWSLDAGVVAFPGGAVGTAPKGATLLPIVSLSGHWR
jgi:hypothetical protein